MAERYTCRLCNHGGTKGPSFNQFYFECDQCRYKCCTLCAHGPHFPVNCLDAANFKRVLANPSAFDSARLRLIRSKLHHWENDPRSQIRRSDIDRRIFSAAVEEAHPELEEGREEMRFLRSLYYWSFAAIHVRSAVLDNRIDFHQDNLMEAYDFFVRRFPTLPRTEIEIEQPGCLCFARPSRRVPAAPVSQSHWDITGARKHVAGAIIALLNFLLPAFPGAEALVIQAELIYWNHILEM